MNKTFFTGAAALAVSGWLLFDSVPRAWADADDKPAAAADAGESAVKRNANGEMVVKVDAATQKRIKLEVANPVTATWAPEVTGCGRVLDPTPLAAEVTDLLAARLSAAASAKELARLKTLAAQDNASARALEAAQLAADHDRLTAESLRTKLAGDWGPALAARKDLAQWTRQLTDRKISLVRLVLHPGDTLAQPPLAAQLTVFPNESHLIPAELIDDQMGVDPDTQGQIFLLVVKDNPPPWGAAVTGRLSVDGPALSGVEVPAAAVLRHESRGWVYLQTAAEEFTRHEIPLDRLTTNGWFVAGDLTTTNVLVSSGAETILSAELSGGGFNTGTRD